MIAASQKRARQNYRLRQAAIAALAVLTLATSGLAAWAQIQRHKANENAQQAVKTAQGADENEQLSDQNAHHADENAQRAVTAAPSGFGQPLKGKL